MVLRRIQFRLGSFCAGSYCIREDGPADPPKVEGRQEPPRLLHDQLHPPFLDRVAAPDAGMVFIAAGVLGKPVSERHVDVPVGVFLEHAAHIGGSVDRTPATVVEMKSIY